MKDFTSWMSILWRLYYTQTIIMIFFFSSQIFFPHKFCFKWKHSHILKIHQKYFLDAGDGCVSCTHQWRITPKLTWHPTWIAGNDVANDMTCRNLLDFFLQKIQNFRNQNELFRKLILVPNFLKNIYFIHKD